MMMLLHRRILSVGRRLLLSSSPGTRRARSYLSPPFLLDNYIPRYQLLNATEEAGKRAEAYRHLSNCNLCPRLCGVNRFERRGSCLVGADVIVGTIAPHFGEEPCIQGNTGSGSVFLSGCNLRCVFCQNYDISHTSKGFSVTPEELGEWYIKLQDVGNCENINLVTPEHVVPQIALSILHAKSLGLRLPIIYNTSSFDSLESLALMDGLVDIYLADFKVWNNTTSKRLLKADNYAEVAMRSIKAMHAQVGDLCATPDGIAKKGVLLRHLVMPGYEEEGKEIMQWLADNVSRDLYVHIMEQYFPQAHVGKPKRGAGSKSSPDSHAKPSNDSPTPSENPQLRYGEINRPVDLQEVASVRSAAEKAGLWRFVEAAEHGGFNI